MNNNTIKRYMFTKDETKIPVFIDKDSVTYKTFFNEKTLDELIAEDRPHIYVKVRKKKK